MTLKQDERIRAKYENECLATEHGEVCKFKLHHSGPHSWQLPLKVDENHQTQFEFYD